MRVVALAVLLSWPLQAGCHHEPDPSVALRAELRALSSENAWLHARLHHAEAELASLPAAAPTACSLPPDASATFRAVRGALANEIARGELEVTLVDDAITVPMPETIGFAGDSAVPTPEGDLALQRLAAVLRRSPAIGVDVVTTVTGAPVIDLSDWQRAHARALSLAWALADLGVSADRITIVSRPTVAVASGPPATASVPRSANVEVVLRPGLPGEHEEQGPLLGVVR